MIQESHFIFRRALAAVPAPQSFAKDWGVEDRLNGILTCAVKWDRFLI